MGAPLVSIIIPVYNTDLSALDMCLNSVLKQLYKNLEIIIVDDGSSKTIADYLDDAASTDNRLHIYHEQHEGVSTARNIGIKNASGNYITFIDADDTVSPDMISVSVECAITYQADIVLWRHAKVFGDKKNPLQSSPETPEITVYSSRQILELQKDIWSGQKSKECSALKSMPLSVCKLYVSQLLKRNNIFFQDNVSIGEDTLFALEALEHAKTLTAINKTMYFHRIHEHSLSHGYHSDAPAKWRNNRKAFRTYLQQGKLTSELWKSYDLQAVFAAKTLLINTFAHPQCNLKKKDLKEILETEEFADSLNSIHWKDVKNDWGALFVLFLYKIRLYRTMILMGKFRRQQLKKKEKFKI